MVNNPQITELVLVLTCLTDSNTYYHQKLLVLAPILIPELVKPYTFSTVATWQLIKTC